jgi:hypothetical protein
VTASAGSTSGTFTSANPGNSTNFWDSSETLDFVASGPTTLITLAGSSGFSYIGVDSVSVVQTSPGGVPEPSTWAMILLGFAGVGYMGYRRAREPTDGEHHGGRSLPGTDQVLNEKALALRRQICISA